MDLITEEVKGSAILIIDDNPTNLNVLFDYLNKYEFKISVAPDANFALRTLEEELPDLILLDILMPEIDGYELCRKLKAEKRTADIPVIFISALSEMANKLEGFEAGGVDYITKPFQKEEVLARVAAHLTIGKQKQQLKQLNANKDKFFSIISHDLKGPVSTLVSFSEMMVDQFEELSQDELKEYSGDIHDSIKQVYALLENLLQWATVQTKRIEVTPQAFVINDLMQEIASLLFATARNKKIKLIVPEKDPLLVYADKHMMHTVLRNLVNNAIKFTPEEGEITIDMEELKDTVEVAVIDTGIGMDEETRAKLFRIDVHHSTVGTNEETGTGLGLIVCKEFVEKNGGEINVDSEVGVGSTFRFTIRKQTDKFE